MAMPPQGATFNETAGLCARVCGVMERGHSTELALVFTERYLWPRTVLLRFKLIVLARAVEMAFFGVLNNFQDLAHFLSALVPVG